MIPLIWCWFNKKNNKTPAQSLKSLSYCQNNKAETVNSVNGLLTSLVIFVGFHKLKQGSYQVWPADPRVVPVCTVECGWSWGWVAGRRSPVSPAGKCKQVFVSRDGRDQSVCHTASTLTDTLRPDMKMEGGEVAGLHRTGVGWQCLTITYSSK